MEHMGGLIVVKDLTEEQLVCLAGGPRLQLGVCVGWNKTRSPPKGEDQESLDG